jgi:two-component system, NtrC family, response regulator AtoC
VADTGQGSDELTQTLDSASKAVVERRYLLVVTGQSSTVFPLPLVGEVIVGRGGEHVDLVLDDLAASRRHARFLVDANEVYVEDLGSHNGTYVDGARAFGVRLLGRGSVVAVGAVSMVLHRDGRGASGRVVTMAELRRRANEEIARLRKRNSELALVTVRAALAPSIRTLAEKSLAAQLGPADVAAWSSDGDLLVLHPDADEDDPSELAQRIRGHISEYAHNAQAGLSACPADGTDVETLLAMSHAACEQAPSGGSCLASDLQWTRDVGGRSVIVVEPSMVRIYALIERLAKSELAVLVEGETGTGKEHAASALHEWSSRKSGPLVAVNCASLPESLAESELFGHAKGAFSGAASAKVGLLEAAHGGTLLLDEVGELTLAVQSKLLRALETKSVMRLGETRERPVDARLVAATHRDLRAEVVAGRFRQDLLYRVGAASVVLPPLRDRRREIPVLARAFLTAANLRIGRLSPLALM